MYAYFTILTGRQAGTNFPLDASRDTLIGRGTDCHLTVPDQLCSRVHAIVRHEDDRWTIRDQESRNGTTVNGQKIDEATLVDGNRVRLGSIEIEFHLSSEPTTTASEETSLTQTIVQDLPIAVQESTADSLCALPSPAQVSELMLLYQLSIRLAGCDKPDEVVSISLELLKERTKAAVVGFLWVDDQDQLKPKHVIPPGAASRIAINKNLTELVLSQGHAVWVANQTSQAKNGKGVAKANEHFADAVCAPLVRKDRDGERRTLGAIHVYLEAGRFRQTDFDFIIAVANLVAIALVRARAHTSLEVDYKQLVRASPGYDELIGESKPMLTLKAKIERVSRAPGCVLVRGESGSGKELVARAIHRASSRADRPMLTVNCAAIPADLMESQLFGHKAGAFTGADRDHAGYFQQADLGTLFLDEVGELTLDGQAKLLRILEGHPFLPVGATHEVSVDVRLIAATNQDLMTYVREKKFREDLYYRLSVFELYLPPLRDRGEDVGRLIQFFLDHYRKERGRPTLELSDAAREKLLNYRWPGNVRQLRNVMDSAVVLADDGEILPRDLGLRDSGGDAPLDSLKIDVWEKKLIVEALQRADGSVPEAARLLSIGRATLYRKIEQYAIER